MKRLIPALFLIPLALFWVACSSDDDNGPSERFRNLTETAWVADSLLINGMDASGPGGLLESFRGEATFRPDGTGTFGEFNGTWRFAQNETELVIQSESLPLPLTTRIEMLTSQNLKVTTSFPDFENPSNPPLQIRLTFIARP